ncbi:MAG: ribonuclease, partial [Alphaproteobacteria bacterium]|nr:ribonuclease [Alphaproteobacteria bacterium]
PEDEDEEEAEAVDANEEDDDDLAEDTAEQRALDAGDADAASGDADAAGGDADEAERRRKRRRRRRRGGRREDQPAEPQAAAEPIAEGSEPVETTAAAAAPASGETDHVETTEPVGEAPAESGEIATADDDLRNRRRGRRGGRRRPRRENEGELSPSAVPGADQPELQPVYAGPTPADPFGGRAFDIFDVMDQAERAAESRPVPRTGSTEEIVNNAAPEPESPPTEAMNTEATSTEATSTEATSAEAPETEPEPVTGATVSEPPVPSADIGHEPEATETIQPEVEIGNHSAPEPAGEPMLAHATAQATETLAAIDEPPAHEPVAEVAIPEPPPPEPLVKPTLVGADAEPPVEKKRGWWRR